MDIPRRKNRDCPDKLTAELLFFCFWLTRCGEVELDDFKWHSGERSSAQLSPLCGGAGGVRRHTAIEASGQRSPIHLCPAGGRLRAGGAI